jgi:hypothetical protein
MEKMEKFEEEKINPESDKTYEAEFFSCSTCGWEGKKKDVARHQNLMQHKGEPNPLGIKEYTPSTKEGIEKGDLILEENPADKKIKYKHVTCDTFLRFPNKNEKEDKKAQSSYTRRLICDKCGQRFSLWVEH